jgi:hypothetical protein
VVISNIFNWSFIRTKPKSTSKQVLQLWLPALFLFSQIYCLCLKKTVNFAPVQAFFWKHLNHFLSKACELKCQFYTFFVDLLMTQNKNSCRKSLQFFAARDDFVCPFLLLFALKQHAYLNMQCLEIYKWIVQNAQCLLINSFIYSHKCFRTYFITGVNCIDITCEHLQWISEAMEMIFELWHRTSEKVLLLWNSVAANLGGGQSSYCHW